VAVAAGWSTVWAAEEAPVPATQKVTLSVPNTQWRNCVAALAASLQNVKGVKSVTLFTPKSKAATVELDPQVATVQQLAQAVADTKGLHGKPYQGVLLLQVEDLSNPDTQKKISDALKDVKGIAAAPVDDKAGLLGITFEKLEASAGNGVGLDQILGPLTAAGVKATVYMPKPSWVGARLEATV
jgi:copper chaperone CopZ